MVDEDLQADWRGVLLALRILSEAAEKGRRLTIKHPAFINKNADMIATTRSAVMGRIDTILSAAIVEREEETIDAG